MTDIEDKLKEYDGVVKEIDAKLKDLGDRCREAKNWVSYQEEADLIFSEYDDVLIEMFGMQWHYENERGFERFDLIELSEEENKALDVFRQELERNFRWWNPMGEWLENTWSKYRNVDEAIEHLDIGLSETQKASLELLEEKGTMIKRYLPPIPFAIRQPGEKRKTKPLTRGSRYE